MSRWCARRTFTPRGDRTILTLRLVGGLTDPDADIERLAAAAMAAAANRRGAEIIQADRDANMRIGRAHAVRRVEGNPAEAGDESLRPGVTGLLLGDAVAAMKMPADITRRDGEAARSRNEDMTQVLAHATLEREGLGGRGRGDGGTVVIGHVLVQVVEQPMQGRQHIAAGVPLHRVCELGDRRVEPR